MTEENCALNDMIKVLHSDWGLYTKIYYQKSIDRMYSYGYYSKYKSIFSKEERKD